MDKASFYKEQLGKDANFFTIEITEIATQKDGIANLTDDGNKVACFYGKEDGSEDCVIPFEEFLERFTIDRVLDDENWESFKVMVINGEYTLVKE